MDKEGRDAGVLIVDNDERIVELMAWFLEKRGYEVRSAPSFERARGLIAARPPDLMLSDLDLGAESALEELPRLAAAGILPPTLVVSGYLDPTIEEQLGRLPQVLGTLAKPFDFAALERRVRECLVRAAASAARPEVAVVAQASDPARAGGAPAARGPAAAEDEEGWVEIRPLAAPAVPQPGSVAGDRGPAGDPALPRR